MKLPILIYGDKRLKEMSDDIDIGTDITDIISNLWDSIETRGVGLAAPQIGIPKSVFIVKYDKFKKVFINPSIDRYSSRTISHFEACLSVPGIYESVRRPTDITVSYYDEQWNMLSEDYGGMISRIIQHEYDHLDGILFIDRLDPVTKRLIQGKLKRIKNISRNYY